MGTTVEPAKDLEDVTSTPLDELRTSVAGQAAQRLVDEVLERRHDQPQEQYTG